MRQIVLDTETTGLDPKQGHRLIELAAVEMVNRRLTGRYFHRYVNPERTIEEGARQVHGISEEFLADKPRFAEVVDEFLHFIQDAELIIHNAPFDTGFLNHELTLLAPPRPGVMHYCTITDTLALARQLHPGQRNNLDALCKRYRVDNGARTLHGALLDAELLAEVYLAMTGGQVSLSLESALVTRSSAERAISNAAPRVRHLRVIRANAQELALHAQQLEMLERASGGPCVWRRMMGEIPSSATSSALTLS